MSNLDDPEVEKEVLQEIESGDWGSSASTPCYPSTEHGVPYVLKKNGMYYAHNSAGYVHRVLMAELYTEDYAKRHASHCDDTQAIPVIDLLTGPDEVQEYIDRLVVMRDAMREVMLAHPEG